MKFVVLFAAVLAVTSAQFQNQGRYQPYSTIAPPPRTPAPIINVNRIVNNDQDAHITRYDNEIYPDGSFNYGFETDNGISAQAQGTPRDFGGNPSVVPDVIQGAFAWTAPNGQSIAISYIADENGYQPSGDAIPTPHPIPEAILKALDFIARNPPAPQQKKK